MTSCLEFIQSVVSVWPLREGRERLDLPMEGTVRGLTVRLDAILVRQAFVLPKAEMEIKRQVRHCLIRDWFPDYQRSGKRYIARTCLYPEWAPALECISMVLLASRRPRTIPGRLIYYIKNGEFDREGEPEERLDFADLMAHSIRREVFAVQAHLGEDKPERYMETFIAIPLTWILIHLGIITGEKCDAPPAPPASPAPPVAPAGPSRVVAGQAMGYDTLTVSKKLLLVRPGDCLIGFLEGLRERCRIIVWSRASLKLLTAILEAMVSKGYLPAFLLDPEVCTLWGGDRVETVHPLGYPEHHVKMKSFQRLYDHSICLRDVLLVDSSSERNSRNHPYSAVHPLALDAKAPESEMTAWLVTFGKWLKTWTESLLPTVEYVRAHCRSLDGIQDTLSVLRHFWGETPQPADRNNIWIEVPSGTRGELTELWPDFYFRHETVPLPQTVSEERPVEEAPAEEGTRVEEAPAEEGTRVDEAPAVEKAHAVEEAPAVEGAPAVDGAPTVEEAAVEEQ
ncbi:hypothetical protein R1sor_000073 [Riccia sorocarpa]|uniref:FCP1 homology domain-containing protein n=1 Tax=Riccia sorocarpa TaxID=122646 RepID=A0ABD3GU04_9MARC